MTTRSRTLGEASGVQTMTFVIPALAPFRLDLTVWALRRRPDNAVDRWDGRVYRRLLTQRGRPLNVAVTQVAPADRPALSVTVRVIDPEPGLEPYVTAVLDSVLGLQIDLADFYRMAATDRRLRVLAERLRGLKPPRFPTLFEALLNAIACQQITLTLGIRLLNRLAETYGPSAPDGVAGVSGFPEPADLTTVDQDALRHLGFSRQKARAILELAQATAAGQVDHATVAALDEAAAVNHLCGLRGVGRWSAEYVLLRGLGRLGVFPGDDVGARNNLRRWLGLSASLDYAGVQRALAPWRSYAGLIYLHLLVDRLVDAGHALP